MNQEELLFEEFLAGRMKDRGITTKKHTEATGIAPIHIENMLRGEFEGLPSAPYFRGYLLRIGKALGFDGEEWWKKLRGANLHNSGPADELPSNRFIKKRVPAWAWIAGALAIIIVIYFAVALPRILGRPLLVVTYPPKSPFAATSTTLTFQGTARNADSLYLSSGDASSSEEIPVAPDGTWQKTVLLQNGLNTFKINAKKFLGAETNLTEQVIYESAAPAGPTASSSASSTQTGP